MPLFGGPPNIEKLKAAKDIKGLAKALRYQKDATIRVAAAKALFELRQYIINGTVIGIVRADLFAALEDQIPEVRYHAGDALTSLFVGWKPKDNKERLLYSIAKCRLDECVQFGGAAVKPLIVALKYPDERFRSFAENALGAIGDPAVQPLLNTLNDKDPTIRCSAAKALGKLGVARAMEPLIATLKDENAHVRSNAAQALGEIGDKRAVDPLLIAFNDHEHVVRKGAAFALEKLGWQPGDDQEIVHYRIARYEYVMLPTLGAIAVEPLIAALLDKTDIDRHYAAKVLGEIGDVRAVEPLVGVLKEKASLLSAAAAEGLGKLRDQRAVEPLIAALKDENETVCYRAAEALGNLGDTRAVEPLISILKHDDRYVRQVAAEALMRLGDRRAVEPLQIALNDEDAYVRRSAAAALEKLGWQPKDDGERLRYFIANQQWDECVQIGAMAVETLTALLKDKTADVRSGAAYTLGKLGDARAVEPLITTLKDPQLSVRLSAATALARSDDVRAQRTVYNLLERNELGEDFVSILGNIGDSRVVDPLIAVLKSQNWAIRKGAAQALVNLYMRGDLNDVFTEKIRAVREKIIRDHSDFQATRHHVDYEDDERLTHINIWEPREKGHADHVDSGIGVDFPL